MTCLNVTCLKWIVNRLCDSAVLALVVTTLWLIGWAALLIVMGLGIAE